MHFFPRPRPWPRAPHCPFVRRAILPQAAASFLASEGEGEGGLSPGLMPRLVTTYPALLAAPVEAELRPRLAFLRALGPEAPPLLRGVLWEDWCGW